MVSLERLLGQASEEDVGRAADILAAPNVIYLLGMRRAFPVTFYLAYALGKLGVRAVLSTMSAGSAPEQLTEASKRDALVAISFTPYTPMTVDLTDRLAVARGADHRTDRQPVLAAVAQRDGQIRDSRGGLLRLPVAGGDVLRGHGDRRGDRREAQQYVECLFHIDGPVEDLFYRASWRCRMGRVATRLRPGCDGMRAACEPKWIG